MNRKQFSQLPTERITEMVNQWFDEFPKCRPLLVVPRNPRHSDCFCMTRRMICESDEEGIGSTILWLKKNNRSSSSILGEMRKEIERQDFVGFIFYTTIVAFQVNLTTLPSKALSYSPSDGLIFVTRENLLHGCNGMLVDVVNDITGAQRRFQEWRNVK